SPGLEPLLAVRRWLPALVRRRRRHLRARWPPDARARGVSDAGPSPPAPGVLGRVLAGHGPSALGALRPRADLAAGGARPRRAGAGPDATGRRGAAERTGDDVVAACNALGLCGGGARLGRVDNAGVWKAADVQVVADSLRSPAPGTTLALVAAELKKEGPLAE